MLLLLVRSCELSPESSRRRKGASRGARAMNHCKRRGSVESSSKIAVAGAVAFKFAGRRAVDEDVPDIKRVEAITFSPRN